MAENDTTTKSIEALQKQVAQLLEENKQLKKRELDKLKKRYTAFRATMRSVSKSAYLLNNEFDKFIKDMEKDKLFVRLTEINNPTSDALGFKFVDKLIEMVKASFFSKLNDKDKARLNAEVQSSIASIKNPVLKTILSINPISALTVKVIEKVSNFVNSVKLGGIKKSFVLKAKKAFSKKQIDDFTKAIKPYVQFYENLANAAVHYKAQVNELHLRRQSLETKLDTIINDFLDLLGITTAEKDDLTIRDEVRDRFKELADDATADDLRTILENEQNIAARDLAISFPKLEKSIHRLEADYYQILRTFYNKNLKALGLARTLETKQTEEDTPELVVNEEKVKALETSLRTAIANLDRKRSGL